MSIPNSEFRVDSDPITNYRRGERGSGVYTRFSCSVYKGPPLHPFRVWAFAETMYNLISQDTLLVNIQETFYDFELTAAFSRAISDQEAAVTVHYALPPTAPNPGNPGAAGPSKSRIQSRHRTPPQGVGGAGSP